MRKNKLNEKLNKKSNLTLSFSRISDFDKNGPKCLIEKTVLSGKGVRHGDLVDKMITDILTGSKEIEENYIYTDIEKPTATLKSLFDIIIKNHVEIPKTEEILEIIKRNNFWSSTKDEKTLISKFNKDVFWKNLEFEFEHNSKKIITLSEKLKAKKAVDILLTHEYTKDLFYNDFENYYQFKFKYKYKNVYLRGIIDKLTIDHQKKIIYISDIKTGVEKSNSFIKSFIKYKYYMQGYIYQNAFEYICKQLNLSDYKLAPFKFIYLCQSENIPIIYIMSDKWFTAAKKGFITKIGVQYKGIDELIKEILFHWNNKIFDISKEAYDNKGILTINDDFFRINI